MQPTTLKELEWIHDCVQLGVAYDTSNDAGYSIRLTMRCPRDLGYAPWAGRTVVLTAIDLAMSKHVVCGVAGPETIDAVRPGISAALRESTMEARRMGVRFPNLEVTICFNSGSSLEIMCRDLRVNVES